MVVFMNIVFSFVSLVFLAAQGAIASPLHQFAPRAITAASPLKNQTAIPSDVIPSACTSDCTTNTLGALTSCTTDGCQCENDVFNTVQACLVCVVSNNALSNSTGQDLLAEYSKTCSTLGSPLDDAVSGASGLKIASLGVFGTMVAAGLLSMVV
jgi:hypothetical protein